MQKISFEVCANSLQSAIAAQLGGADRIELCAQLDAGGITPSAATIKLAIKHLSIPVFVLIRPRSGDFIYNDHDIRVMKEDIIIAKELGAAGVVIGLLTPKGEIDIERTCELVQLAKPMQFTFHRAFDRARDPLTALEDLIRTGADRILTSGQKRSAWEGRALLKTLVEKASGRITILAGASINPDNVSEIIDFTGVREVHASCSLKLRSKMEYASALDAESPLSVTDVETVKQIVALLKKYTNHDE
jgi:copper homeostasis protein